MKNTGVLYCLGTIRSYYLPLVWLASGQLATDASSKQTGGQPGDYLL